MMNRASVSLASMIAFACLSFGEAAPAGAEAAAPSAKRATLNITVALVDREMQVRAVPLHPIALISGASDTTWVRTNTSGKATATLPAGRYSLSSMASVNFEGARFRWRTELVLEPGLPLEVDLTNDNAVREELEPAGGKVSSGDRAESAAVLFERFKRSIFRIEAGLANGTGFLVDTLGGVIVTNAHVVGKTDAAGLSVLLEPRLRVRAQLLARDEEADIAVLRVHPRFLVGRERIVLQNPEGKSAVVPGERLIAMGFPLHQELTITSGIASSVRAGAIISDVNINPGSSGGPLLRLDGEAVAVNTFGDLADRGAGVSGSVLISRAGPALATSAAELQKNFPVSEDTLPTLPSERMSVATLKAYADTTNIEQYRAFTNINLGGFTLSIRTPAQTFVAMKAYENEIAGDRKKREAKAGLSTEERYSEVREYRDWLDYVGQETIPVVAIAVVPKVGETGGSVFARMMINNSMKATYKFQADVRGVQVYRNGSLVGPIRGGHTPTKAFVDNSWVSLKDVADEGFYLFDPEFLRPDSNGVAPTIAVIVQDLKSPKKLRCRVLPAEVVALAWNDFKEFYRAARPGVEFVRADIRSSKLHQAKEASVASASECTWYSY